MSKHSPKFIHPFQISICGFSNSGKTTLIESVVKKLSNKYKIGFLKNDAHKIQIDKEGKDTSRIKQAGADMVFIHDSEQFAGYGSRVQFQSEVFSNCDFLLSEGWKYSKQAKIILLDKAGKMEDEIKAGKIENILAIVGQTQNSEILKTPYFQRDNIENISDFIESYFIGLTKPVPLKGLVLTGGLSSRMKKDKSQLNYHGKIQAEVGYDLLNSFCEETFISCRDDQNYNLPRLTDTYLKKGPMGGILSAMDYDRASAWLVIACDLPMLSSDTLSYLIHHRNPIKIATTYLSAEQHLPEPLCTIYEPHSRATLLRYLSYDMRCPRKMLINSNVENLELIKKDALINCNTPEEYNDFVEIQK